MLLCCSAGTCWNSNLCRAPDIQGTYRKKLKTTTVDMGEDLVQQDPDRFAIAAAATTAYMDPRPSFLRNPEGTDPLQAL